MPIKVISGNLNDQASEGWNQNWITSHSYKMFMCSVIYSFIYLNSIFSVRLEFKKELKLHVELRCQSRS